MVPVLYAEPLPGLKVSGGRLFVGGIVQVVIGEPRGELEWGMDSRRFSRRWWGLGWSCSFLLFLFLITLLHLGNLVLYQEIVVYIFQVFWIN